MIRVGDVGDAERLAALINRAYEVERFFVEGNRTSAEDVRAHMRHGAFLVALSADGGVAGTVFVEVEDGRGFFGMLAVDPTHQKHGWGGRLIAAAERHARESGARVMSIQVVNLRDDLLPRYRRLGYVPVGVEPYVHRPTIQACHFIVMEKPLGPA